MKRTDFSNETAEAILASIEHWQNVQKYNAPSSLVWQAASETLAPLFKEMAERRKSCWVHDLGESGSCKRCGWPTDREY